MCIQNGNLKPPTVMEIMMRSVLCVGLCLSISVGTCLANCSGKRTKLKPDEHVRKLTLPDYPSEYAGSMVCKWTIYHVYGFKGDILIKIVDLDIESTSYCQDDSLALYGYDEFRNFKVMHFCGSTVPNETYYFGGAVSVVFRSNKQTGGRGFLLQYNKPDYEESDDDDDRYGRGNSESWGGVMIGVCVAMGVVLLALLVATIYCTRRRKTKLKEFALSNINETEKPREAIEKPRDNPEKPPDIAVIGAPDESEYAEVRYLGTRDI